MVVIIFVYRLLIDKMAVARDRRFSRSRGPLDALLKNSGVHNIIISCLRTVSSVRCVNRFVINRAAVHENQACRIRIMSETLSSVYERHVWINVCLNETGLCKGYVQLSTASG